MYALYDTFNNRIISRHRTVKNVAIAAVKHDRAVKRANGSSSYIPTEIRLDELDEYGNLKRVHEDDQEHYDQILVCDL